MAFSQCWLAWSRQLDSNLAQYHRLVAMDMRGHGSVGQASRRLRRLQPVGRRRGRGDPRAGARPAGPLRLVVRAARHPRLHPALRRGAHRRHPLRRRRHEARQRGGALGAHPRVPRASCRGSSPRTWRRACAASRRCCGCASPASPTAAELYLHARLQRVRCRRSSGRRCSPASLDNDDLLPTIRTPVLITHGARDAIVTRRGGRAAPRADQSRASGRHGVGGTCAVLGRRAVVQRTSRRLQ